jgi:hypothetical protein
VTLPSLVSGVADGDELLAPQDERKIIEISRTAHLVQKFFMTRKTPFVQKRLHPKDYT